MSVNMSKGQRISLEKQGGGELTKVRMGLGWDAIPKKGLFGRKKEKAIDLDASCVVLDDGRNEIDAVWFRKLKSTDGVYGVRFGHNTEATVSGLTMTKN